MNQRAIALNDVITSHMRTDYTLLDGEQTVAAALEHVRAKPPEGRVVYFYVVDGEQRLCGVVPTRRLLLSSLDTRIADIMVKNVVSLPSTASILDACEFFTLHRLLALPVVDDRKRMIGLVDVELYTDELAHLETSDRNDDLFSLIGVRLVEARQGSLFAGFTSRFPWLLTNIAGGILAAFISGMFEQELANVALAMFIPVVLALAESVSIQSVSLSLQVLHGGQPTWADLIAKLRSEAATGIFLGIASSAAIATVAYLWRGDVPVAWCLLVGIAGGVTCAALIGLATPYLLRMMRREPQVAAGPIALALSDMVTLLIYFSLARWLLG